MTHGEIWDAIDSFARSRNMTCSCMARRGGLNATTFNPSKRVGPGGKERWPSMQSVVKVLDANNAYMIDFARFCPMPDEKEK